MCSVHLCINLLKWLGASVNGSNWCYFMFLWCVPYSVAILLHGIGGMKKYVCMYVSLLYCRTLYVNEWFSTHTNLSVLCIVLMPALCTLIWCVLLSHQIVHTVHICCQCLFVIFLLQDIMSAMPDLVLLLFYFQFLLSNPPSSTKGMVFFDDKPSIYACCCVLNACHFSHFICLNLLKFFCCFNCWIHCILLYLYPCTNC